MRRAQVFVLVAVLLAVTACTGAPSAAPPPEPSPSATPTAPDAQPESPSSDPDDTQSGPAATTEPAPPGPGTTDTPATSPTRSRKPPHPVSVPALFDKRYDGRRLRLGQVLARTDAYTQYAARYRSEDLTITGVMNVPAGRGPFPVLVLAHGYIEPSIYVTGQGLRREQDWLARAGYVVLHVDYRNHAGSDDDPRNNVRFRLGYTVDVINAVRAVRRSDLRFLDGQRIGLLGRSMGGGVLYNVLVAQPGLVDAAVIYSPVSSLTVDNFNRWIRPDGDGLAERILDRYGTPKKNPRFWRQVSPRPFFDRITEPVLIHHGTADESTPFRWSRQSIRALDRAGANARLVVYPGQPHAFTSEWSTSMRRTVRFFDRHLG